MTNITTCHTRCMFIAVVGAPNVGKSTLVNYVVGAKVSIVSPKVQTTRMRVMGICIKDDAQLIFIDTPGIFQPRRRLDRAMVAAAWGGADEADITILMVDSKNAIDVNTQKIIDGLKKRHGKGKTGKVILVLNKVDLVQKKDLLVMAAKLDKQGVFSDIFMISAKSGDGVDDLVSFFAAQAASGPWHFSADQLSDMPQRLLSAEITREKMYLQLRQELPYAATVETEEWQEKSDGAVTIRQIIYIERSSQKSIVLGKGGQRIKSIGEASRKELEEIFARRVHLFLFVKVRDNWGDDPDRYRAWGLNFNA